MIGRRVAGLAETLGVYDLCCFLPEALIRVIRHKFDDYKYNLESTTTSR